MVPATVQCMPAVHLLRHWDNQNILYISKCPWRGCPNSDSEALHCAGINESGSKNIKKGTDPKNAEEVKTMDNGKRVWRREKGSSLTGRKARLRMMVVI